MLQLLDVRRKLQNANSSSIAGVAPFLTHLDLSDNLLTRLPTELVQLENLKWLDVSNNQITELPSNIGCLHYLEHLNVSHNRLTSLPKSFIEFRNHVSGQISLTKLLLDGNQITAPPKSIVEKGIRAIVSFFEQITLEIGDTSLPIAVACLGNLNSGKSALIKNLEEYSQKDSGQRHTKKEVNLLSLGGLLSLTDTQDTVYVYRSSFSIRGNVPQSNYSKEPMEVAQTQLKDLNHSELNEFANLWESFLGTAPCFQAFTKNPMAQLYPRYFHASGFIDWMIENTSISNRSEACRIGGILEQSGLIKEAGSESKSKGFADKSIPFIISCEELLPASFQMNILDFSARGMFLHYT